jgi:hypothetical protein
MRMRYAITASIVAAVFFPLAFAAHAGSAPDSIWIKSPGGSTGTPPTTLPYGSSFTAGYTSKTSQPWAFAQCWANSTTVLGTPNQGNYKPGDAIWSEYRSLYPGGPVPAPFDLTDPIQGLWLGGGADCTLSLVKFSGGFKSMTVLASSSFTVSG